MNIHIKLLNFIKYHYGLGELLTMVGVALYFMILRENMPLWIDLLIYAYLIYNIILEKIYDYQSYKRLWDWIYADLIAKNEVVIDIHKIIEQVESNQGTKQ